MQQHDIEGFFRNRQDNTLLSARELEVVSLVAEGLNNECIASRLFIDLNTVSHHLNSIYNKLLNRGIDFTDKHKRVYLVILYLKHSLESERK